MGNCKTCGLGCRMDATEITRGVRCGRCKTVLPPPSEPLFLSGRELAELAQKVRVPLLTVFIQAHCLASKALMKRLSEVSQAFSGRALIAVIDGVANFELFQRLGFEMTPAFTITRNGRLVLRSQGIVDAHEIARWLRIASTPGGLPAVGATEPRRNSEVTAH